jgi:BirA family biotin operon repressor/biotin-[acetyl-CoA-carboxylase] ligase
MRLDYDIYRFGKIDSTNSHLLKLGEEGFPEGTVVVADEQTAGRGRFGRSWEAEPQTNLLFSLLLRPHFLQQDEIFVLTFAAAVSVAEVIEKAAGVRPQLKWPNDVLLEGKKVCGILLESSHRAAGSRVSYFDSNERDFDSNRLSHVVLGIGLNVNQQSFSPAISSEATSLSLLTGRKFDRDEILSAILANFSSVYESLQKGDFYSVMKKWRDRSIMFGKKITISLAGKTFEGICDGVTDDGALVLQTGSGLKKFTAGEITILSNRSFEGEN